MRKLLGSTPLAWFASVPPASLLALLAVSVLGPMEWTGVSAGHTDYRAVSVADGAVSLLFAADPSREPAERARLFHASQRSDPVLPRVAFLRTGVSVNLPLWLPLAVFAYASVLVWRARSRALEGHCGECSYSLEGLPDAGPCPECGHDRPSTASPYDHPDDAHTPHLHPAHPRRFPREHRPFVPRPGRPRA